MKKNGDINSALAAFEDAVNKYADALEKGNSKTANKNFDKMTEVYKWIKSQNKVDYLLSFLGHASIPLRMLAASYLLEDYEKEAVRALEEIKNGDSFFAYDAELTLEEWKKGNLTF